MPMRTEKPKCYKSDIQIVMMQSNIQIRYGLQYCLMEIFPNANIISLDSLAALSECPETITADLVVSDLCDNGTKENAGAHWLIGLQFTRKNKPLLVFTNSKKQNAIATLVQNTQASIATTKTTFFELSNILGKTLKGERVFSTSFNELFLRPQENSRQLLTKSESKVYVMLRSGYSVTQIAHQLSRSVKTISSHKRKIMQKFGVTSEVEMFAKFKDEHG